MKKLFFSVSCCLLLSASWAQPLGSRLQKAFAEFEADSQLKHAISSLYVIDAGTGQVIFGKNEQTGLAPASTQKIITATTAFELLGKEFRYTTWMGYSGHTKDSPGYLYWSGSGDPTFGSWRYSSTRPEKIFTAFTDSIRKHGITKLEDAFYLRDWPHFDEQTIPDGWIMQDIGNYYGAGTAVLNWKENQYDLQLQSGNQENDPVTIITDNGSIPPDSFINQLAAGKPGSGDNAYIYLPMEGHNYLLKGSIPVNEKNFTISGAVVNGPDYFINEFRAHLNKEGLLDGPANTPYHIQTQPIDRGSIIASYVSPSLDSIIYWFLKKSVNLYGEALVKTLGLTKLQYGSTEAGVEVVKDFWQQQKMDITELNITDGSGLSPLNRVTTHAQVEILKYARTRNWYPYFYDALPEYNGMKMKSGTISRVKGFCGYHKAKNGKEYIFSFLVNNYSGSSSGVVSKMYKVLDLLK